MYYFVANLLHRLYGLIEVEAKVEDDIEVIMEMLTKEIMVVLVEIVERTIIGNVNAHGRVTTA
uniref:AlNc14C41G3490 protein n=1 Tax=Albugo laibachii Nc14 TaxID=890382 RepID=F0W9N5_9STRA|nr:AlNc14C41G3490 [Albugo laibachii Nc14]|eukprot:CCA17853.1 AlNc14C41G3490 [Albugo laibachii Nc14]